MDLRYTEEIHSLNNIFFCPDCGPGAALGPGDTVVTMAGLSYRAFKQITSVK